MSQSQAAADAAARAAERFATELSAIAAGPPARVEVRLDGAAGMAGLCAVEAVLARAWPTGAAKELVWLTRTQPAAASHLQLRAYGPQNELLAERQVQLGG